MLWETPPRSTEDSPDDWWVSSFPVFLDWREQVEGLDELAASRPWHPILTEGEELVSVVGAKVTADFLSVLRVEPLIGRSFMAGEDEPGATPVVILGHGFWQRRFGGDAAVLGATLAFDDSGEEMRAEVVGILPPRARISAPAAFEEVEILTPLHPDLLRGRRYFRVVGRLAPDASAETVRARLGELAHGFQQSYPESHDGWGADAAPLEDLAAAPVRPVVRVLLTAASLLFLVAVANVGILRLLQESDRRRDLAVRVVLGASPPRIWRQMLVESLLVSAGGAAAGLAMASVAVRWLPAAITLPGAPAELDRWSWLCAAGLGLLTTAAFTALPALRFFRCDLSRLVQAAGPVRLRVTPAGLNPRRGLVLVEISLALVLVIAAVMLLQSFRHLSRVDPGFDPSGALTLRLRIPQSLHPERAQIDEVWRRLPEQIESMPHVLSAGLVNYLPMQGASLGTRAWATETSAREGIRVEVRGVSSHYFQSMGIPVHAGRDFTRKEIDEDRPTVVISAAAARRLWLGEAEDAVGRRLGLDWLGSEAREVVGVVKDVKHHGITAAADPAVYLPLGQAPRAAMTLVVRSVNERPTDLAPDVRARVLEHDPTVVIEQIRSLPQVVGATLIRPQGNALALAAFALVSVFLSAGGIYSVVSYSVARRRHDLSVRLALGAHPRDLVQRVAAEGLRDAVVGVGIGLILFVFLAQSLSDLLFGVRAGDPWVLAAMSISMIMVAWVAAYLPARKAAGIDPAPSLRAI